LFVRRLSALFGFALLLSPTGLRFAIAGNDSAAMRCAIACGHAMDATKGAVCCPMGGPSENGTAWKVCPGSDPQGIAAPMRAQPAVLVSGFRLLVPASGPLGERGPGFGPVSRPASPPDHVPIFLS
jgi:hypothetical protein